MTKMLQKWKRSIKYWDWLETDSNLNSVIKIVFMDVYVKKKIKKKLVKKMQKLEKKSC